MKYLRWVITILLVVVMGIYIFGIGPAEPVEAGTSDRLRHRIARLEKHVKRQELKLVRLRWKTTRLTIDGEYVDEPCHDLQAVYDEFGRLTCPGLISEGR